MGCETAYWLKYEKGCDVTVVEMLPYIMSGACTANRYHLIHYMEKAGVKLLNCAKVTGFTKDSVQIERTSQRGSGPLQSPGSHSFLKTLPIPWLKKSARRQRYRSFPPIWWYLPWEAGRMRVCIWKGFGCWQPKSFTTSETVSQAEECWRRHGRLIVWHGIFRG